MRYDSSGRALMRGSTENQIQFAEITSSGTWVSSITNMWGADATTSWDTTYGNGNGSITMDLGQIANIKSIFFFADYSSQNSGGTMSVTFQYSTDNTNWTTATSNTGISNTWVERGYSSGGIRARYFRYVLTKTSGTIDGRIRVYALHIYV